MLLITYLIFTVFLIGTILTIIGVNEKDNVKRNIGISFMFLCFLIVPVTAVILDFLTLNKFRFFNLQFMDTDFLNLRERRERRNSLYYDFPNVITIA